MRTTFDIAALRMIVTGAELGSFARAAARLGRSQSAVSMQLKKLEEQTGKTLFRKSGRGLVPTEAGDALLAYARRIIALNDEAAASLGASPAATVRLGLPQDFAEDVLPEVILRFAKKWPLVQVEAHAGRNYALWQDVESGRLDVAIAFVPSGSPGPGMPVATLPLLWLGGRKLDGAGAVPLALFDHPCLFRQHALEALETQGPEWRLALTTPSLPGVWAALRSGLGVTVRTPHRIPAGIADVRRKLGLPPLPRVEVRLFAGNALSPAAADLRDVLQAVVQLQLKGAQLKGPRIKGRG
ncbi:MAG TPA: LysR substrate-binding domain-containing protein [Dongiaceae bacterium]|nr:LysR substrate-binding domain-containing protein [Dongiaceae bacterium]